MNEIQLTQHNMKLALALTQAPAKYDKYIVLLFIKFGLTLTKSDFAKVINKSQQTVDRRIKEARNIPAYLKSSEGSKSSYIFPIVDVANYLCNTIKVS